LKGDAEYSLLIVSCRYHYWQCSEAAR